MTDLTNRLADLAEQVKSTNEAAALAERTTIEKALEAGHLLTEAKALCAHGQWYPFLDRAGIHERQASRLMQLAASGLKSDTVSDLGGIKGALAFIAKRNAAVAELESLGRLVDETTTVPLTLENHAERVDRLGAVIGFIEAMAGMFEDDAAEEAREAIATEREDDALSQAITEIWAGVDQFLTVATLKEAHLNLHEAMRLCEKQPSDERYEIVARAFHHCQAMIQTSDDLDACFIIANDTFMHTVACRIDALRGRAA
ncbi:DUF3102 domain-containing protein [Sinorhizobium fredii]|uniref:DUF3102 domain-containing protein n=1 Tax=Rhizobium fredii TaxID=380 RepID=UPI0004BAA519|nr:DUF3102 domain-containing protein [Sinorhizobium fredii]